VAVIVSLIAAASLREPYVLTLRVRVPSWMSTGSKLRRSTMATSWLRRL